MPKEVITQVDFLVSSAFSDKWGGGFLVKTDENGEKSTERFSHDISERDQILTYAIKNNLPFVQVNTAHEQDVLLARRKTLTPNKL